MVYPRRARIVGGAVEGQPPFEGLCRTLAQAMCSSHGAAPGARNRRGEAWNLRSGLWCTTDTVKRLVCALVVALAAGVPAAATAKEAPQAHLLRPLPKSATPGHFIVVRWSVTVLEPDG